MSSASPGRVYLFFSNKEAAPSLHPIDNMTNREILYKAIQKKECLLGESLLK